MQSSNVRLAAMASRLKSLLPRPSCFSGKTAEQGQEIDLEAARGSELTTSPTGGSESEGRPSLSTQDHPGSFHGENSKNFSHTIRMPEEASPDEDRLHPVVKILRKQELAKHMVALTIPLASALLANHNLLSSSPSFPLFLILITIGFTALWIGNLLHEEYPFAKNIELLGYVLVLLVIFGTVVSFLGLSLLAVIPLVCWIATMIPLGLAFRSGT